MSRLRTVALVARDTGVAVLRDSLLRNAHVDLACVAAHRLRPRVEDPERGERPEWAEIDALCRAAGVPLVAADTRPLAGELEFLDAHGPIDLACAVSWR